MQAEGDVVRLPLPARAIELCSPTATRDGHRRGHPTARDRLPHLLSERRQPAVAMVQVVTLATGKATELTVDGHAVTVRTDHNGSSWTPDAALLVNRFD